MNSIVYRKSLQVFLIIGGMILANFATAGGILSKGVSMQSNIASSSNKLLVSQSSLNRNSSNNIKAIIGTGGTGGSALNSNSLAQLRSRLVNATNAVIGTGTPVSSTGGQTNAVIGTGSSITAIIGTGKSSGAASGISASSLSAVIGTGNSTQAVIGTGQATSAVIGTGLSRPALLSSGSNVNAVIGTGQFGNAVIGTGGPSAPVGSANVARAVIGTGVSAK